MCFEQVIGEEKKGVKGLKEKWISEKEGLEKENKEESPQNWSAAS